MQEVLLASWRSKGPGRCSSTDCIGVPERQVGTFSARFRGPGFYATDYPSAKKIKDIERNSVVAYTPEQQREMKRRGVW